MKPINPRVIIQLLLLCCIWLSSSKNMVLAQPMASMNPAVIDAEGFCTDPTQLISCGVNIPGSPNSLTIAAGEPVYLEFAVTNTGIGTLVHAEIVDNQFGVIFDQPTSIGPGNTTTFRSLQTAPSTPGTYNIFASYIGTDAAGNTTTTTETYTIIVPPPSASINPTLTAATDFCTDPSNLSTCGVNIPGDPNTLTIGAGEPIYLEYDVTNTGIGTLVHAEIVDNQFGVIFDQAASIDPGNTSTFRSLQMAPNAPGTYNIFASYIGTDAAGNTTTATEIYTIIVSTPSATINPTITAAADFCTDPSSLNTCGVNIPGDPNTLTIGAGEPIYLEYDVTNTGSGTLVHAEIVDNQFGVIFDQAASIDPGNTSTFRSLQMAPNAPGTYNIFASYIGTDAAGNTTTATEIYTIIVPPPSATINPTITAAADFCTDPSSLNTCGVNIPGDPNTLTIGAGEPIYLEYNVTNTGIGTLVHAEIVDNQFGIIIDQAASIDPGNTTIFRSLQIAPTTPGTYNIFASYIGTDAAGNTTTATEIYTIIVQGPNADFRVLLGDADDFCTDDTSVSTCSDLPDSAPNTITLVQNEPYLLEYLVQSTGTRSIVQHKITDEALGTVLNTSAVTLPPGALLRSRRLLTAPSTPGTYNIEATYEGTDANGIEVVVTSSYTLEVLDFDANFNVAVANAATFCSDPSDQTTCGTLFPDMTNEITVPPGGNIYLEYQIIEAGEVPVVVHSIFDNNYGPVITDFSLDITTTSGSVILKSIQTAPSTPGIYTYTVDYIGEDEDGNTVERQAEYTITVGCPEECFIQGPSGTICPGTYEFSADFDATLCTNPLIDWVVTNAAGAIQTYTGNPIMVALEGCSEDYTIEATVSCVGCPEPVVCTTTITTEDTTPPDMQCTTVEVTFNSCPDGFGPNFPNGEWLQVGPTGILNEAFGGIFTFPVDLNGCLSDNCTDLAELEYTLNDSYTESFTPGCSLTMISELRFRDKCGNISPDLLILRGTIEEANPTPPTISCPADMTITCLDSTEPSATGMATGSNDCGDEVSISFNDVSVAGCGNTEVITRTWTATNGCGQTTSCDQIITVVSVTPTIDCPADITIDCAESTAPSNTGMAMGEDLCGGPIDIAFDDVFIPGCSAVTGTITRTWTATNECGLSTSCEQIITIVDNTAPVFDLSCQIDVTFTTEDGNVCPADATISLTEGDELTVNDGWTVGGNSILPLSGCVEDNCTADNDLTITVDDITIVDNGTCSRTITVTFLADDGCGNVSDPFVCNYTFLDDTGPEVNFNGIPDMGTYVVECDLPSTTWDPLIETADLTISDNCSAIDFGAITVELTQLYDGPCVGNVLTRWRQVWVVPDVCGNETTYTLFTEIVDNTAPEFTSTPADLTLECDQEIPDSEAVAFDSCSEVEYSFTEVRTDGDCPNNYTLTRTWTATDGCGNANSTSQIITVEDTTSPDIIFIDGYISGYSPGDDVFVECSEYGNISQLIANSAFAKDNCSGVLPTTYTFEDLGGFDCAEFGYSGHLVSTWTATDECGNTSVATINWFLVDQTAPVLQGVPEDLCASELPPVPNVQAVDDCEFAVLSFNESDPLDCDGGQYVERTWTATDICGNTSSATQRITLTDGDGPTISVNYPPIGQVMNGNQVQLSVDCNEPFPVSLAELEDAISVADGCNEGQTVVEIDLMDEGDCREEGYLARYRVNVTAMDVCGNTSTLGFIVDLIDDTPPVVESPAELVLRCGEAIPSIIATDACGDVAEITFVDSTPIVASCADDPQVFERIWTLTDQCGNSTTFAQSITILDLDGPIFTGIPADACNDLSLDVSVVATDECSGMEIPAQLEEVTTNEMGCGEVLTRTWTATDACGNTTTEVQQVFFADDVPPSMTFAHPLLVGLESGDEYFLSVGSGFGSPEDPYLFGADAVAITDNCASNLVATVSVVEMISDDCAADGFLASYAYEWEATDPCGNSSKARLTVYYIDKGSPDFFDVPANLEVYCDAVPAPSAPIVRDDYDNEVAVSFSETQTSTPEGVLITRTWTAVDNCGNVGSTTQEILVVDNTLSATFELNPSTVVCNSDDNLLGVIASGGTPPYSYEWDLSFPLEDGYITSDPTQPRILFTMGFITQVFTVTITDANGCELVQSFSVVCDFSGEEGLVEDGSTVSSLSLYPNPTDEFIRLSIPQSNEKQVNVAIYSLLGQEMHRQRFAVWPVEGLNIDTRQYPEGTYVIRVEQDGQQPFVKQFVVQHR